MNTQSSSISRHVVISGGSRGLGQALVEGLLTAGYRVSAFSRRATAFTKRRSGDERFHFATADVENAASLRNFLDGAEARFGAVWGLVNCAGVAADGVLATMLDEPITHMIDVNLVGTLSLTREVVRRLLVADHGGVIVNVSSIIGLRGYSGLAAYAATKAGMDAITRSLCRELGSRGIRVNSVAPGYLETEMSEGLGATQREQIIRRTPLGRLGVPDDVTGAILFLLSDASAFISGQVLVVDGGITA